jgi:hypothetical protein
MFRSTNFTEFVKETPRYQSKYDSLYDDLEDFLGSKTA